MTFSLIARDPDGSRLGIAVASHYFGLASLVPWVEPGVGVVATQRRSDPTHGPLALSFLREGRSAGEALEAILAADAHRDERQIAIVDGHGRAAAHTGSASIAAAGHVVGEGASAQGNFLASDRVWAAMLAAYERQAGSDFVGRLVGALLAGEAAGGDARGQLAATVIVVGADRSTDARRRMVDLRVEHSHTAVDDLAWLVALRAAYDLVFDGDPSRSLADRIAESRRRSPDEPGLAFRRGLELSKVGDRAAAHDELVIAARADVRWLDALERVCSAGGVDREIVDRVRKDSTA